MLFQSFPEPAQSLQGDVKPQGTTGLWLFLHELPAPGTSASSLDQQEEMPEAAGINPDRDNSDHQMGLSRRMADLFGQKSRMVLVSSRVIHPSQLVLYSDVMKVPFNTTILARRKVSKNLIVQGVWGKNTQNNSISTPHGREKRAGHDVPFCVEKTH